LGGKINEMKVEEVRIDSISNHSKNPKQHPDKQLRLLEESIKRFGWTNPVILSKDGVILAGHARVKAAISAGNDTVPCIRTKLTGAEADAYLIADNRLSDLAPYDRDILVELLGELPDDLAELTGFDSSDIDALLKGEDISEIDKFIGGEPEEREEVDAEPQIDRAEELNKIWKVKTGDLWQCGDHRIICGDCTDPAVVERVMGGEKAASMWTDPPYGVSYVGKTKDALTIENDGYADLPRLLEQCFKNADVVLEDGAPIYIAHPAGVLSLIFGQKFVDAGWKFHETLVWIKNSMVLGHSDYHYKHEPILYGWKGTNRKWYAGRDQVSTLEYNRPQRSELHPTMKPIDLVIHCLNNSTKSWDTVYEPFCGSGTTLLACENINRKCRSLELSPDYCAVILQRFKDATGKEPVRVE